MIAPVHAVLALAFALVSFLPASVLARDHALAVGSSTIYPFATAAAEQLGQTTDLRTPQVEAWGSGGGIKHFCAGLGLGESDLVFASREMADSEIARCAANGVTDVFRMSFGWDGIILATAHNGPELKLTLEDLYLALASRVPDPNGAPTLIPNPYRRWSDLHADLPEVPIYVYGPPATSGTRDFFVENGLLQGCAAFSPLRDLQVTNPSAYRETCGRIREDGPYVSVGENDNLIVRKVAESDHAVGILGFSYFDQNHDRLKAAEIDTIAPGFESIYDASYALARPLYVYVKGAHLGSVRGLGDFLREMISARASGPDGYLVERGLIPLTEDERARVAAKLEAYLRAPRPGFRSAAG
jgi:phosphate transport system substrate-binding protein